MSDLAASLANTEHRNALERSQDTLRKLLSHCKNQSDLTDEQIVGLMTGQIQANDVVLKRWAR